MGWSIATIVIALVLLFSSREIADWPAVTVGAFGVVGVVVNWRNERGRVHRFRLAIELGDRNRYQLTPEQRRAVLDALTD